MADSATLTAAPEAADAPAKKGKSKLLMIIVLVLVVAGAAYWFVLKPKDPGAAAAAPPPAEKGEVVPLEPIYINLAQGHFLKLGIALQATKAADVKHMDGSEALDSAIEVFSGLELEELSQTEVRAEHKAELVEMVVESYEDHVMDVYFTEFVMQ
jgi:flagellar FliL protein